jgi:predicted acetyltransferase
MHGAKMGFGAVGPVACLAPYRRQGHVAKLLTMSLELMRERGQVLSGLYTPHDALYRRFGWERAEMKKRYRFRPKDVRLRFRSRGGRAVPVPADEWQRLDALFRTWSADRNGPFIRNEIWWREAILHNYDGTGSRTENEAVVWVDEDGQDRGYMVYLNRPYQTRELSWDHQEIWVRDFVALTANAYLGLWLHMLTHDLAESLVYEAHPDDRLPDMVEDPAKVQQTVAEGAMLRIVDLERAIERRPYSGGNPASVTARVEDRTLPWNDGTWRIEAAGGEMRAERTDAPADVEMSVNALAALFSGYVRAEVAAQCGLVTAQDDATVAQLARLFAVRDAPNCPDFY